MKQTRFQYEYRESASSLHRAVGEILRTSPLFENYQAYQEYPVVRVNTQYPDSSHHFDWVIMDMFLVIECHGRQHYEATDFSGKAEDGGLSSLRMQRRRDNAKKNAALEAGFTYIEIPYTAEKELSESLIWGLYKENLNEAELRRDQLVQREPDPTYRQRLERAREYRKDQYRRAKDRIKARRSSGS